MGMAPTVACFAAVTLCCFLAVSAQITIPAPTLNATVTTVYNAAVSEIGQGRSVTLTKDGKTAYVADETSCVIWVFDLESSTMASWIGIKGDCTQRVGENPTFKNPYDVRLMHDENFLVVSHRPGAILKVNLVNISSEVLCCNVAGSADWDEAGNLIKAATSAIANPYHAPVISADDRKLFWGDYSHGVKELDLDAETVRTLSGKSVGHGSEINGASGPECGFSYPSGVWIMEDGENLAVSMGDVKGEHKDRWVKVNIGTGACETWAFDTHTGYLDGPGMSARRFGLPTRQGFALSPDRNFVFFEDHGNDRIRAMHVQSKEVYTVAGSGSSEIVDGTDLNAAFEDPKSIAGVSVNNKAILLDGFKTLRVIEFTSFPWLDASETCSDGFLNQDETDIDCGGNTCDPCPTTPSATFTPFGAAMTAPLLSACPTSNPSTEAVWVVPTWGRCWSSTITATKSTGMVDTNNDWTATLSLTDGLGTNYYVTTGGTTTTWTIYWREQDLAPTNLGGYSQDIQITVTETIAAATFSTTDDESQVFTVTLARDLFGSVSSATDAGAEELVSFANARMHRVEGASADVYYAALTFIASSGTIDVDITEVTAKGTAATWPKIAAESKTSYNPCSPLSGAVNIAGQAYPLDALDADCAPSLDLCSTDTTTASRVDVYIPLDLGTTFDTASHSVTLVLVVKDAQSNNFQEFYISISPSNGFVTWCDSNLAGVGAPNPSDVLNVDFHVGLSDSPAATQKVTDGERAELAPGSAFSRTGSIIALTASAKGGHGIELEDVKVFWDFDGSVVPNYGVSYSASTGEGQLTAQHFGACSSSVCKEVAAAASGQENLFHTYATDVAAKDFIQPSPRTSEVDSLLDAYLSRITVPSEGTLYNTYLVDPTVELSSPVNTVYVFALFKIRQQDGSMRRMLLQQAGPTSPRRGSDGAASAAVRFDVTPAAFAAYTLDISPELVTSWNLQLQTSEGDACLPAEQLLQNVRTRLLVHLSSAATALRDVQIVSLTVNKAGVSCSASRPQRRRKLLAPSVAGPFVTVEVLFIFDDAQAAKPTVDIAKLQAAPGVLSVLQTQTSSATSAVDIIGAASPQAPAPLPSSPTSSSPSALHLTLAAAAGAALVVAVLGVVGWVRRMSARRSLTEVQAVALNLTSQTVHMDKNQIECGQCAQPIDEAAITAMETTTVKLTPGPMETIASFASLSETSSGMGAVLPRSDNQKNLVENN